MTPSVPWARDGLPAIAVSVEDPTSLTPVLRDARSRGVRVLTWDADADPEAREYTVVPATPAAVAHALSFELGRITGGTGSFAIITSTLSAPNQTAWIAGFKKRFSQEHPELELLDVRPCDDVEENARQETLALLKAHPQIKAVVGFCSPAVPGAARALKEAERRNVRLTGISMPSLCRDLIEDGTVDSVVLPSLTSQLRGISPAFSFEAARH